MIFEKMSSYLTPTLGACLVALTMTACISEPDVVDKGIASMLKAHVPPQLGSFFVGYAFPLSPICRARVKSGQSWHSWSDASSPLEAAHAHNFIIKAHISTGKWLDYGTPAGEWIVERTSLDDTSDVKAVEKTITECVSSLAMTGDDAARDLARVTDAEKTNRKAWQVIASNPR